jgi:uncharacterized membrane protein YdjX (TVP38/TMEM64 family)
MSNKTKSILLLGLPIGISIALSLVLQFSVLTQSEKVASWLGQFGNYVILVYILIQALTIIIAPIGGQFLQVAMLALFPAHQAFFIIYLTVTPLYLFNFLISRKYGRPLVSKVVGKKALDEIDKLSEDFGSVTLIILKVFQSGLFDYLSYAAGLTKISFKHFALINIFAGIPAVFIAYFVFTRFDNLTFGVLALIGMSAILGAVAIYLKQKYRQKKSS